MKQSVKRHARNVQGRSRIKTLSKKLRDLAAQKNVAGAAMELRTVTSVIAKAAKAGVIHKRAASRRISRLAKAARRAAAAT